MSDKVIKGYSLYITAEDFDSIRQGVSESFMAGWLVSKLKPVFEAVNPPKGSGKPEVKEDKKEEVKKSEKAKS